MHISRVILILHCLLQFTGASGQPLPGFKPTADYSAQLQLLENRPPNTRILIDAPIDGFGKQDKVLLIFYALPNGNTIEQTIGKKLKEGDDWHYNIQHIGAQTDFLRKQLKNRTIVTVYLENNKKSWPAWVANTKDSVQIIRKMVEEITEIFTQWHPEIVLNGHSGGGRFVFSYLDAVEKIPEQVVRIAFLDSEYGFENDRYGPKLLNWLQTNRNRQLCALAYNDSVVIYNGKPLVSPTGGTWYRTKMMQKYLNSKFRFKCSANDSLIKYQSPNRNITFIFKTNPDGKIFHTTQVERNGFIHSILSGTRLEEKRYRYFGERAYNTSIRDSIRLPIPSWNIPERTENAKTGY